MESSGKPFPRFRQCRKTPLENFTFRELLPTREIDKRFLVIPLHWKVRERMPPAGIAALLQR